MTILVQFLVKALYDPNEKTFFLQIFCTDLNSPGSTECKFIDFHRTTPVYVRTLSSCTNLKLRQAVQQ